MQSRLRVTYLIPTLLTVVMTFSAASTSFAQLNRFTGEWKNVDPNTRGVTKLDIAAAGNSVQVHAWGQCHPSDCDWGMVQGYAYARGVQENLATAAHTVSAVYRKTFSEVLLVIHPVGSNQLRAETMTRFTDSSGRTNHGAAETFSRAAPSGPITEDCVSFNPQTAAVSNTGGRWKIVDGRQWMFDFGSNQGEADRSLRIIQHYGFTQSCFMRRPNPTFQYLRR